MTFDSEFAKSLQGLWLEQNVPCRAAILSRVFVISSEGLNGRMKLSQQRYWQQTIGNATLSFVLIAAIVASVAGLGYLLGGTFGLAVAGAACGIVFWLSSQLPLHLVGRVMGVYELKSYHAPELFRVVEELSIQAGLDTTPRIWLLPRPELNAFAIGSSTDAAIGVTPRILEEFDSRRVTGILAHEISHIKNHDLTLSRIAGTASIITSAMSNMVLVMIVLYLHLILLNVISVPWSVVALLFIAPTGLHLARRALSRTREFQADLDAAKLTGDPRGLALALAQLERSKSGFWDRFFGVDEGAANASWWQTHPTTQERVDRLLSLEVAA